MGSQAGQKQAPGGTTGDTLRRVVKGSDCRRDRKIKLNTNDQILWYYSVVTVCLC